MPTIMQPMYLKELYGAMLPGVKKIACHTHRFNVIQCPSSFLLQHG